MIKVSLKLKITLWYVGILVLISFLILYAMTALSRTILTREVEERVVTSVVDLYNRISAPESRKVGMREAIPEYHLYNNGDPENQRF